MSGRRYDEIATTALDNRRPRRIYARVERDVINFTEAERAFAPYLTASDQNGAPVRTYGQRSLMIDDRSAPLLQRVRNFRRRTHRLALKEPKEILMSDLVVVAFDTPQEADNVLTELKRLQKEYLIDLADAVVVVRQPDGKINLKQSTDPAVAAAKAVGLGGAFWGALVGLLFLNPIAGFAIGGVVGAGAGALAGKLSDYGIKDKFIRSLAESLKPDNSALFILVRKVQLDRVLNEINRFNGRVLHTSLSPDQEGRLQKALSEATAAA